MIVVPTLPFLVASHRSGAGIERHVMEGTEVM